MTTIAMKTQHIHLLWVTVEINHPSRATMASRAILVASAQHKGHRKHSGALQGLLASWCSYHCKSQIYGYVLAFIIANTGPCDASQSRNWML